MNTNKVRRQSSVCKGETKIQNIRLSSLQHVFNFQIVQGTDRIELIVVTDLDDYHE